MDPFKKFGPVTCRLCAGFAFIDYPEQHMADVAMDHIRPAVANDGNLGGYPGVTLSWGKRSIVLKYQEELAEKKRRDREREERRGREREERRERKAARRRRRSRDGRGDRSRSRDRNGGDQRQGPGTGVRDPDGGPGTKDRDQGPCRKRIRVWDQEPGTTDLPPHVLLCS